MLLNLGSKILTGFTLTWFSPGGQLDISSPLSQAPCWGLVLQHNSIKLILYALWNSIS